jgi:hypothetical protein
MSSQIEEFKKEAEGIVQAIKDNGHEELLRRINTALDSLTALGDSPEEAIVRISEAGKILGADHKKLHDVAVAVISVAVVKYGDLNLDEIDRLVGGSGWDTENWRPK